MAIQKENVSIDVQDIIELLHSGYTWFKKDDLGYGSIQEKYNALDIHIKTIQQKLKVPKPDGIYGPVTKKAVIAFQKANPKLGAADGVVGPKTWAAIIKL